MPFHHACRQLDHLGFSYQAHLVRRERDGRKLTSFLARNLEGHQLMGVAVGIDVESALHDLVRRAVKHGVDLEPEKRKPKLNNVRQPLPWSDAVGV